MTYHPTSITALMLSCIVCVTAGAAPDDTTPADGTNALITAAHEDDLATVRRLVADGEYVTTKNRYGVCALSLACKNGSAAMVHLLLENGADPDTTLNGGETALMTASRTGRVEVVNALLKAGARIDAKERQGQTALMWAAAEGHADVVDTLIKAGADYKTPLKSGFTSLSFAVRNGHTAVTERLIAASVDIDEPMTRASGGRNRPVKNTSPLLLAMENGHFQLAALLLDNGADANDDRTGFAPLHAMSWIRKPEKGDNATGTPPAARVRRPDLARLRAQTRRARRRRQPPQETERRRAAAHLHQRHDPLPLRREHRRRRLHEAPAQTRRQPETEER